ncbi:MAG TPA: hypothetical protein VGI10_06125 [Polyangiaceae bacterium]|jgi:hypothetical protein
MASESEPEAVAAADDEARSKRGADRERPRKKKSKRPRPPLPRTEEEINSPTRQTLGMLGILGGMTLVMWALAHGACNYHPPKETRNPRAVGTPELASDPKNAAIEFQQRLLTHNFDGALELASGAEVAEVQKAKAACNAQCLQDRSKLEKTVFTSAALIARNPLVAVARATSVGSSQSGPYEMNLEHVGQLWKVSARVPASAVTAPSQPPAPAAAAEPSAAPAGAAPAASQ